MRAGNPSEPDLNAKASASSSLLEQVLAESSTAWEPHRLPRAAGSQRLWDDILNELEASPSVSSS